MTTSSLSRSFQSLPNTLKSWLVSETVTDIVISLNASLRIQGKNRKILGNIIISLITGILPVRDVINEIGKKLHVNFDTARTVARDIYEKILKPMNADLKALGINAQHIIDYSATPDPSLASYGTTSSLTAELVEDEHVSTVDFRQAPTPLDSLPVQPSSSQKTEVSYNEPISSSLASPTIENKNALPAQTLTPSLVKQNKGYSSILDRLNTRQPEQATQPNPTKESLSTRSNQYDATERALKEKVINQVLKSRLLIPPAIDSPSIQSLSFRKKFDASPPDNLPITPPPLTSAPQKPFVLHHEDDDFNKNQSRELSSSFRYTVPDQYRQPSLEGRVTVEIEKTLAPVRQKNEARLVHYCKYLTPLHQATITRPSISHRSQHEIKNKKNISLPTSRWFVS